jgi:hypothetical protein
LVAALALVGCAKAQTISDQVFPLYEGKPIESLIVRWGVPRSIISGSLGGPIYVWDGDLTTTTTTPVTSAGYVGAVPFAITIPTTETISGSCRLEAHTDKDRRILGITSNGAGGACRAWLGKLR